MKINSLLFRTNGSHSYYFHKNNQRYSQENQKNDTVSFGMRINYGIPAELDKALQSQIAHIYENVDFIQDFFKQYTKKQYLAAKIRDGYTDLISKRSSGFIFKLPDSDKSVEIFKSQTRPNILYISINEGKAEFNGIVIDEGKKLIANYLKLHPHMLPSSIKYMDEKSVAKAEPEKFITLADEKIQAYREYIMKVQSGEIPIIPKKAQNPDKPKTNTVKYIDRTPESKKKLVHKPLKLTTADYGEYMTGKVKSIIKKISELLSMDAKDFPEYITPKLTPAGKALGLKLSTDDGETISVIRKTVPGCGNSMPYLSFEKVNKDGTLSYTSLDMISNKVLRTKEKGKPHISDDGIVYELSPDEIKKRKIEEKLDYYMKQIFREPESSEQSTKAELVSIPEKPKKAGRPKKEVSSDNPIETQKVIPQKTLKEDNSPQMKPNIEKLKEDMRLLGDNDGKIAAEEYFKAFKERFMTDMQAKIAEFKSNLNNLLTDLMK